MDISIQIFYYFHYIFLSLLPMRLKIIFFILKVLSVGAFFYLRADILAIKFYCFCIFLLI